MSKLHKKLETVKAKRAVLRYCAAAATAATLLIVACSTQKTAPDPAEIQMEIAASKVEELDLVRATIPEPERAERFIDLLAKRDLLLGRYTSQIADHKKEMARLNADYRAERGEFETQLADYNSKRITAQKELVDLLVEMKQVTTADEWNEISAFQLDRLDLRRLAYSGPDGGGT
jgi:major membrane immunogen (membrane-anchored lipoprotein)